MHDLPVAVQVAGHPVHLAAELAFRLLRARQGLLRGGKGGARGVPFLLFLGVACPTVGVTGVSFAGTSQAQPQQSAQQSLSDLDREFLIVINFANLWEVPMGDLAAERGTTQRVRDVGAAIAADHRKLDTAVTDLAGRFRVPLTDTPSSSTAKWTDEIRAASGEASARTIDTPENSLSGGELMLGGVVATVVGAATIGIVRTFSAPGKAEWSTSCRVILVS